MVFYTVLRKNHRDPLSPSKKRFAFGRRIRNKNTKLSSEGLMAILTKICTNPLYTAPRESKGVVKRGMVYRCFQF